MKTKFKKNAKVFLAIAFSAIMVFETWGGQSLVANTATSTETTVNTSTEDGQVATVSTETANGISLDSGYLVDSSDQLDDLMTTQLSLLSTETEDTPTVLATSTTTEEGNIGTAFPETFDFDSTETDYYIETVEQLKYFQAASQTNDFAGITIHLAASLDWGGSEGENGSFDGIGTTDDVAFCGTFDGHGYTISNLYSTTSGLFAQIGSTENPATITNFTLDSANISGEEGTAIVVSRFNGNNKNVDLNNKITDVTVVDSTASFSGSSCGIIAGRCQTESEGAVTISGCTVANTDMICAEGSTADTIARWGMIIGRDASEGYSRISECTVTGSDIKTTDRNISKMGIIAGYITGAVQIDDCTVKTSSITNGFEEATAATEIGIIVGVLQSSKGAITDCTITNSKITSKALAQHVGLLAGRLYGGTVDNNTVVGSKINVDYSTDSQSSRIGGLVGNINNTPATISNCTVNRSTIKIASRVGSVGGFVGNIEAASAGTVIKDSAITNSKIYNTYSSSILYSHYLGGVVGRTLGQITATNVDVADIYISTADLIRGAAGFAGYINDGTGSTLTDCSVFASRINIGGYNDKEGNENYHVAGLVGCVDSASTIKNCNVEWMNMTTGGRTFYYAGLVGSTYSDGMDSPASGAVTIDHCSVTNTKAVTARNRACAKVAGLVGCLAEGSTVSNGYVNGFTGVANTNSMHEGGIIGYIAASTGEATSVTSCLANNVTINGKNLIGATIGNCVATNATLSDLWYYNCTVNRSSGGSVYECTGEKEGTATNMTNGEAAWNLNTVGGTKTNSYVWTQGSATPEYDTESTEATVRVTYIQPSGTTYVYTDSTGNIITTVASDTDYAWSTDETYFTTDTEVSSMFVGTIGVDFPEEMTSAPTETDYCIKTKAQLESFQAASQVYDFAGITIHLLDEIDWGGEDGGDWAGIGYDETVSFSGTFNGHGHTISNLYSTTTGLFYIAGSTESPATIKDFTIKDATISGDEGVGIVVSRINGNAQDTSLNNKITDVSVVSSTGSFSGNNCGVIVGRCQNGTDDNSDAVTISGCTVTDTALNCTADTTDLITNWGLMIGQDYSLGYTRINDCTAKNSTIESTTANMSAVGAIAGLITGRGQIDGCKVDTCAITSGLATEENQTSDIGGIIGRLKSSAGKVTNCTVTDTTITTKGLSYRLGLLVGHLNGGTIKGNTVSGGSINTTYNESTTQAGRFGGVIGAISSSSAKITDTNSTGVTINNAGRVNSIGGIIGSIESASAGTIVDNCKSENFTFNNTYSTANHCYHIGGALGRTMGKAYISNVSVDNANITSAALVKCMAGFIGYVSGEEASILTNCTVANSTVIQTTAFEENKSFHIGGLVGCVDSPSKFAGCSVTSTTVQSRRRSEYVAGLIGSTYSNQVVSSPVEAAIIVQNCQVKTFSYDPKDNRNINESGGLIGWLSEGSTVKDCYVSGITASKNRNNEYSGGLIGCISNTGTSDATIVKNCYVENCSFTAKSSSGLGDIMIGVSNASNGVYTNLNYYNCSVTNAGGVSGTAATEASLTDGTLVTSLNTTAGTETSTGSWAQGTTSPVLASGSNGTSEVKLLNYNIYYEEQNDSYPISDRRSKVIDMIDKCVDNGVGVITLQEVRGTVWHDYIADYVADSNFAWCGYGRYGGTFGNFSGNDSFNLILFDTTKYTKTDEGHFWLSETPDEPSYYYEIAYNKRCINWIQLKDKTTGSEFVVVDAHLEETRTDNAVNDMGYTVSSDDGPTARILQAQLICDMMTEYAAGLPVIIAGDFNSAPGTDAYDTIIDNGYQCVRDFAVTADTHGAYNAFDRTDTSTFAKGDHVFTSGLCTATLYDVLSDEDIDSATGYHISDHCPIISVIQY